MHRSLRFYSKNTPPKLEPKRRYRALIGDVGDTILSGKPMIRALQMALFNSHGIVVHPSKLYKDFGQPKGEQIKTLLQDEFGQAPSDNDVTLVESEFTHQLVHHYETYGAQYLPGTLEGIRLLRQNGILFGCTTGLSEKVIDAINKTLPDDRPWPIVYGQRPSSDAIDRIIETWNIGRRPADRVLRGACAKTGDSRADWMEAKQAGIPFVGIVQHRAEALNIPKEQIEQEFKQLGALASVNTLYDVATFVCSNQTRRKAKC